jgi:PiT family inorganic phosphate transporter
VISGGIMGAGAAKRLSAVRWGIAGNMVIAWLLTIPAAGAMGGATWGITRVFGTGVLGPLLVFVVLVMVVLAVFARRFQQGSPIAATTP